MRFGLSGDSFLLDGRPLLCPVRKPCRAAGFKWWSNEPPRDTEIAELLQPSADSDTIDGGLGGTAQDGLFKDASPSVLLLSVAIDVGVQPTALGRGDGLP